MVSQGRTAVSDRALLVALGLFLAVSFGLRVWYGSFQLHAGRVWDEQFEVENVAALLDGAFLETDRPWPASVFYPSLSYLPHAGVLGAAQGIFRVEVLRADGGFTPAGYFLARATGALFGTLSLLWLFRVGCRLFDPEVALAGVALLAVVPWHLRMSAVFKPDALMVLMLLVAVEAALWVAERPGLRRYLGAGAAVGLAVAAKYNALAVAVPVAVGALLDLRRRPRRLLLLAPAAALAALAAFYLLNPFLLTTPELLDRDFGRTLEDYERKGEAAEIGRLRLPLVVVSALASGRFHGVVLTAAALAGLAILAFRLLAERPVDRLWRERLAVFLSFPAGYLLLYLLVTTNPAEHNWLPLTPFTSLAAAWLLAGLWRRLTGLVPGRWRRPYLDRGALALVLAGSLALGASYTYSIVVPATWVRAADHLRAALSLDYRDRAVVYDLPAGAYPAVRHGQRNKAAVVPVDDVGAAAAGRLARSADARIHLARRAPAPGCLPGDTRPREMRFRAAPFESWGPPVVLYLQRWRRVGTPRPLVATGPGEYRVSETAAPAGAWLSVRVVSAPRVRPLGLERAELAGRPVRLLWGGMLPRRRHQFVSERVPAPPSGPLTLRLPDAEPGVVGEVSLLTWLPPAGGEPCRAGE